VGGPQCQSRNEEEFASPVIGIAAGEAPEGSGGEPKSGAGDSCAWIVPVSIGVIPVTITGVIAVAIAGVIAVAITPTPRIVIAVAVTPEMGVMSVPAVMPGMMPMRMAPTTPMHLVDRRLRLNSGFSCDAHDASRRVSGRSQ